MRLAEASEIGREICSTDVLSKSKVYWKKGNKTFINYNIREHAAETIEKADRACIQGFGLDTYGMRLEKQLEQLRLFRTWDMSSVLSS